VEYASVSEAKAVLDKQEKIVLDGYTLFIDYGSKQGMVNQLKKSSAAMINT